MSDNIALGSGAEFDIIRELVSRWGRRARGIGDDAAVLDVSAGEHLLVSTDTSVEHVHFRREWLEPEEIGYRAVAAALSDLAAMAATPLGLTLALSVPESWRRDLARIGDGVGRALSTADTCIVGGDITASRELVIGVTVLGSARAPVRRDGARVGDVVYVTGTLGGPAIALDAWLAERAPSPIARDRFARPVPRLREARWLAAHGATAMIDISDGLLGDASHVAHASGVRIELTLDTLPVIAHASVVQAARSGEEYELLLTAQAPIDAAAFERGHGIPLTAIGRVVAGAPEVVATVGGVRVAGAGGFDHFS